MDSQSILSSARNLFRLTDAWDWDDLGSMDQDKIEELFEVADGVTPDVVASTYTAWLIWQAPDILEPFIKTNVDVRRFCHYLHNWGVDFGTGVMFWDHLVNEIVTSYNDEVEATIVQEINDKVRDLILRSYPLITLVNQQCEKRESEDHCEELWVTLRNKRLKSRQLNQQPNEDKAAAINAWMRSISPSASADLSITPPESLATMSSSSAQSDLQPGTPT